MPDRLVLPDCHQPVANDAPASSRGIVVPRTGPCPPGAQPPPVLPRQPGQVSSVPSAIEAVTPGIEPAMTAVQAHVGRLRRSGTESSTPVHHRMPLTHVRLDAYSLASPVLPCDQAVYWWRRIFQACVLVSATATPRHKLLIALLPATHSSTGHAEDVDAVELYEADRDDAAAVESPRGQA